MARKKTALEVRKNQIRIALAVMGLLFVIVFFKPVWDFFLLLISVVLMLVGVNIRIMPASILSSLQILGYTCCISFGGVMLLFMAMVSWQSILPNALLIERYRSFWHLFLYIFGLHGPAIFVKDGKEQATTENLNRLGPGVLVVDFNSAAVLEEQVPIPGILRPLKNLLMSILIALRLSDARRSPRVCSPGITFMRRRERLRGVVDLRQQFRTLPGQPAYTNDGIEVTSNIITSFTLGQDADILGVTFVGEVNARNLRIVRLRRLPPTPTIRYERVQVERMYDDLDEVDRDEVMRRAAILLRERATLADREMEIFDTNQQNFNPDRVFAAIGSQARDPENNVTSWVDLPARVAADIYRQLVLQYNYDYFYQPLAPDRIQMQQVKDELRRRVQYDGILSYRFVQHTTGRPLRVNSIYPLNELAASEIFNFNNSKLLRDRGIKVLICSFSDLTPPVPVYRQKLEAWLAPWARDAEINRAGKDLEASRIRSMARRKSQSDLAVSLNSLLNNPDVSPEVLAVRVFQSMEELTADPATREMLPADTLTLMRNLRGFILPGDESFISNSDTPTLPPSPGGR